MMEAESIIILGSLWKVKEVNSQDDPILDTADGYCDTSTRTIVISDMKESTNRPDSVADIKTYKTQVIRHEMIHAFMFECGLGASSWADNEEIVDWLAIQFPKLSALFTENGVL